MVNPRRFLGTEKNHHHSHGKQGGGEEHLLASCDPPRHGFMSAADKCKLDGIDGNGQPGADGAPGADGLSGGDLPLWGDGSDGDMVIASGATMALDRIYFFNNLTVEAGGTLHAANATHAGLPFPIYVKETLTLDGVIHINGEDGFHSTPGAGYGYSCLGGSGSGEGGYVITGGTPTAPVDIADDVWAYGGDGGAGGDGTTQPGGLGGHAAADTNVFTGATFNVLCLFTAWLSGRSALLEELIAGGMGGGGGGKGTHIGDAEYGGGGGGGGGVLLVNANIITGSGVFQSKGGDGGSSGTRTPPPAQGVNGGGGGGGGGGVILVLSHTDVAADTSITYDVSPGIGGAGNGAGQAGGTGTAGRYFNAVVLGSGGGGGGPSTSPLTTKGDLWGYDTADARVPVGTDDLPLIADSSAALGLSYKELTTPGIADAAVTYPKIQDVSAEDLILGRVTAGAGPVEEIPCTPAARDLLDDPDADTMRNTLEVSPFLFGDGSDGDLTHAAGTLTLTRHMYYRNLRATGGKIVTSGFRVYGSESIVCDAVIEADGNVGAAGGGAGGMGGLGDAQAFLCGGQNGGNGGGAGAGGAGQAVSRAFGGNGGAGGNGLTSAGGAGGVATAPSENNGGLRMLSVPPACFDGLVQASANRCETGGGGGGGGGTAGNPGGGGGSSAYGMMLFSPSITGAGTIRAEGGAGGAGSVLDSGGGGGGSGGYIVTISRNDVSTTGLTFSVAGGAGGAAGGGAGLAGAAGAAGRIFNLRA